MLSFSSYILQNANNFSSILKLVSTLSGFFCFSVQSQVSKMKATVERLERELEHKEKQLRELRQKVDDLEVSKQTLAQNANLCLEEMRGYLLQYQQTVLKPQT